MSEETAEPAPAPAEVPGKGPGKPDQTPGLNQQPAPGRDPAEDLYRQARATGLTRDIQAWREARRR